MDFAQCFLSILHGYLFLVNKACVSLPLSIFSMYFSSHLNSSQM